MLLSEARGFGNPWAGEFSRAGERMGGRRRGVRGRAGWARAGRVPGGGGQGVCLPSNAVPQEDAPGCGAGPRDSPSTSPGFATANMSVIMQREPRDFLFTPGQAGARRDFWRAGRGAGGARKI